MLLCCFYFLVFLVKLLFDGPPQSPTEVEDKASSQTNKADNVNKKGPNDTCQKSSRNDNNTESASSTLTSNKTASVPEVAVTTSDGKVEQPKVVRSSQLSHAHCTSAN